MVTQALFDEGIGFGLTFDPIEMVTQALFDVGIGFGLTFVS